MASGPTPTRGFAAFSRHTSGSGVSSTDTPEVLHSNRPIVHRNPRRLWTVRGPAGQRPAASNAAATSSRRRSAPNGATIWTPTGSPSAVVPAGTEMAGHPVTVIT